MKRFLFSLFAIVILLNSCKEDSEELINTKFYYSNQTQYHITMKIFNSDGAQLVEHSIAPLSSASVAILAEGGAEPFEYNNEGNQIGDSIYITFGEERYLICKKGSHEIFDSNSYEFIEQSSTEHLYNYTFTDDHYENATVI